MSNIFVGQTIRVFTQFSDFDVDANTDQPVPPSSVIGKIYLHNGSAYVFQSNFTPTNTSLGAYYYDWTTLSDGKWKIVFTGLFNASTPSTVDNSRVFYVGTAEPTVVLSSDLEFSFLGELDPLYLDPEEIKRYYADVNLVEATEIIHRLSRVLDSWFGANYVITQTMLDWILATTLCELSKIYVFDGGLYGFGIANSFTLGELQVSQSTKNATNLNTNGLGLGQATTWCEIAALLKIELTNVRRNPKSFVKGSSYGGNSAIPIRSLRNFD